MQSSGIYAGIYNDCQATPTVGLYRQIVIQETLARSQDEETNTNTHQWINTLLVLLGTLAALCFNPLFSGRKLTKIHYLGESLKIKKNVFQRWCVVLHTAGFMACPISQSELAFSSPRSGYFPSSALLRIQSGSSSSLLLMFSPRILPILCRAAQVCSNNKYQLAGCE